MPGILDLPPELLARILLDVFSNPQEAIEEPDSVFKLTALNLRVILFRQLSLVHRLFHHVASQCFFDDVPMLTVEAIRGLKSTFVNDDRHGLRYRFHRTCVSFYDFQRSRCTPRAPRDRKDGIVIRTGTRRQAWTPSTVSLASHWNEWQAECASVFKLAPSLRHVEVDMAVRVGPHRYGLSWTRPSLTMRTLLAGLLAVTNLRSLSLADPVPLSAWGPALAQWSKLESLSIILRTSGMADDFSEIQFSPPRSLTSLALVDETFVESTNRVWPQSADLAQCTALSSLTLADRKGANVRLAVSRLVAAYSSTLCFLQLHSSDGTVLTDGIAGTDVRPGPFSSLRRLVLGGDVHIATLAALDAPVLVELTVGRLVEFEVVTDSRLASHVRTLRRFGSLARIAVGRVNPDADWAGIRTSLEEAGIQLLL